MTAYKFRPSENMRFIFDILINNRLFCSDWSKANDPLEGGFLVEPNDKKDEIYKALSKYRVCCLSEFCSNHLMWAHYANEFRGVTIEVNLPDDHPDIRLVSRRHEFLTREILGKDFEPDEFARKILFSKYKDWMYENEIRILTTSEYFYDFTINRVITGQRIDKIDFEVLKIICNERKITLDKQLILDDRLTTQSEFEEEMEYTEIIEASENYNWKDWEK